MARPPPKAATGLSVKEICDEFGSEPEGHDLRSIRIMERELRTLAAAESTAESLAKIAAHLEPKKGLTWEEAAKTVGWREHTVSPKDAPPPDWDGSGPSLSLKEGKLLKTRRFSVEDLCRVFGISPTLVGESDGRSAAVPKIEDKLPATRAQAEKIIALLERLAGLLERGLVNRS